MKFLCALLVLLIAPSVFCQVSTSFTTSVSSTTTLSLLNVSSNNHLIKLNYSFDYTQISAPIVHVAVTITVNDAANITNTSTIAYQINGNTTNNNLDSSTLPVPMSGSSSHNSLIPPCRISTDKASEAGITISLTIDPSLSTGISVQFSVTARKSQ